MDAIWKESPGAMELTCNVLLRHIGW